jgi:hypothetical protein
MRAVVVREKIGPDGAILESGVPEPEGCHPMSPGERMLVEVHRGTRFTDSVRAMRVGGRLDR